MPTRRSSKKKKNLQGFRSGSELALSKELKRKRVKYQFEPERFSYVITKTYLPDFYLEDYGFWIEVKGRFLPADRKKHLLIREQHPDLDIRFMFDNPRDRLSKGSKTRYGEWAEKNGFLYCKTSEGIPKEWLKK